MEDQLTDSLEHRRALATHYERLSLETLDLASQAATAARGEESIEKFSARVNQLCNLVRAHRQIE